jgi:hypothetical protein
LDNGLAADREVLVSIALKQQNLDELHRLFFQVSDPQSPMYAQYLSLSELRELVAPSMENIKALTNFLFDNGYVLRYLALWPCCTCSGSLYFNSIDFECTRLIMLLCWFDLVWFGLVCMALVIKIPLAFIHVHWRLCRGQNNRV